MNEEKFEYTYSAPTEQERREVEDIKKRYVTSDVLSESKMDRLKKLNKKATYPPKIVSAVMGTAAVLLFGLGMTFVLEWDMILWGVLISAVGAALGAAVYPVYKRISDINKKKYGKEILELSDEILNKTKD